MILEPFVPDPFPPTHLKYARFSSLLKHAHVLLEKYNALLSSHPRNALDLLSSLTFIETYFSLRSTDFTPSFEEVLRSPSASFLNYRSALLNVMRSKQKTALCKHRLCSLHDQITRSSLPTQYRGTYRKKQTYIGMTSFDAADFIPPVPQKISLLMQELMRYSQNAEKDPLIQTALLIGQLMIIHPFKDGNGRLGRILIPLFLFQNKAIRVPILFLSRYFKTFPTQHHLSLFSITELDQWELWIETFLYAIIYCLKQDLKIIPAIFSLYEKLPKAPSVLIRFLSHNPFFTKNDFQKNGGSIDLLQRLTKKRLIIEEEENTYSFQSIIKILNRSLK